MEFTNTFWALVPPIVAIVLALITKETFSSLFVGIIVGALLATGLNPIAALDTLINDGFISAISGNAGIFMFLVILGVMVALVNSTGAAAAFGRWASRRVKTKVGALLATFVLGVLIFIDDYFNCLTVGSVMRPVTDLNRVSRTKLAYLIDSTAAPVCMIAPISSWAAAVSGVARDLNVDGIQLFISAIPFNYYSLLTLLFVIMITVLGFDYGPMAAAELKALRENDLGSLGHDKAVENSKAHLLDMVIPIILLIVFCVLGMLYVGGFWDAGAVDSTSGKSIYHNLPLAFSNTDASVALPLGSIVALILSMIYLLIRRTTGFKDTMGCIAKGFEAMVPAILILTFAVTLKNMTGLLGADVYVGGVMEGAAEGLYKMLPAIIFLVGCGLAFATGTSWGTFSILIPIVLPIFSGSDPTLLIIGISACLAGAVCGDHCSPISDTTIMASAGANCDHIQHVRTQLPYALTVAAISFVNYIIAGFVRNAWICLGTGAVITVLVLIVLRATVGKKTV